MGGKDATTTFLFMGDSHYGRMPGERSDYVLWGQLLRRACSVAFPDRKTQGGDVLVPIKEEPAVPIRHIGPDDPAAVPLLVLGGDVVNRPEREDEWTAFFAAGGETLRGMRVITATGNRSRGRVVTYEERFDLPDNGPAGLEQRFFSFDHGCCHFIVLDSSLMGPEHDALQNRIREWIRQDLMQTAQPVIFAVQHHPMVTIGTSEEDERRAEYMRRTYQPLLEEAKVDMILCGHQHLYCRSKRIVAGAANPAAPDTEAADPGMIQLMGVSGTKFFDAWDTREMECVRERISVATIIRVTGDEIHLQTIDGDGHVVDELIRPVRQKCRTSV